MIFRDKELARESPKIKKSLEKLIFRMKAIVASQVGTVKFIWVGKQFVMIRMRILVF